LSDESDGNNSKLRKEINMTDKDSKKYEEQYTYYNHDTFQMHVNMKRKNRIKNKIARAQRKINRSL